MATPGRWFPLTGNATSQTNYEVFPAPLPVHVGYPIFFFEKHVRRSEHKRMACKQRHLDAVDGAVVRPHPGNVEALDFGNGRCLFRSSFTEVMEMAAGAKAFQKVEPKAPPSGLGDAQYRPVSVRGAVAVAGLRFAAILTAPKLGSLGSRKILCCLFASIDEGV